MSEKIKEKILDGIIKSTKMIRSEIVYSTMKIFTPNFYKQNKEFTEMKFRVPRPFTLYLKDYYKNKSLIGCEIGFGHGLNAISLLEELNIEKLYCIDPMKQYKNVFSSSTNYFNFENSNYSLLQTDLRIKFIKKISDDGFNDLPKNLDFIYIDGLHTEKQCYNDIINSISHTNIIGGHDFRRMYQTSVIKAVLKATIKIQITPHINFPDDWFNLEK